MRLKNRFLQAESSILERKVVKMSVIIFLARPTYNWTSLQFFAWKICISDSQAYRLCISYPEEVPLNEINKHTHFINISVINVVCLVESEPLEILHRKSIYYTMLRSFVLAFVIFSVISVMQVFLKYNVQHSMKNAPKGSLTQKIIIHAIPGERCSSWWPRYSCCGDAWSFWCR